MPIPHPLFSRPDAPGTRERAKVVIIGQAPSLRGSQVGRAALGGPTGDKLMALLGIDLKTYVRSFRRLNLIQSFPGRVARGDSFPAGEAQSAWWILREQLAMRRVLLLGVKVADAAVPGWRAYGWCRPFSTEMSMFLVVPHPSGLNHWWNDARNTTLASQALREYCHIAIAACNPTRCHACGAVIDPTPGLPRTLPESGDSCPGWHDSRRHVPEPCLVQEAMRQVPFQQGSPVSQAGHPDQEGERDPGIGTPLARATVVVPVRRGFTAADIIRVSFPRPSP